MTKRITTAAIAASLAALAAATPSMVSAQRAATTATATPVIGVADIDVAVQQTAAFTAAVAQIQTTYAPQITNLNARRTALQTELTTLGQTVQTEQGRSPVNQTALNAAVTAYRTREAAAQQEIQTLSRPIDLSIAYVREQITMRLGEAVRAAAAARRVDAILTDGAVIWSSDALNMNAAIVTELNRLVPNVQIVPPAGYEPGSLIRAQQAAAQGAAAQPATTTPPAAQPQSR